MPEATGDALVGALDDLIDVEQRLGALYDRLVAVPLQTDTLDPAELAIENLLLEVGAAQHRTTAARMTAEIGCRRIGRLPRGWRGRP